ncbi:hypothetical protein F2Q69_00015049 [Brassica cretica]|uniref:Uncharacterized protein n=1 Tax=Brassica cretica TaxID=69181 RepID=A0A8S9R966_BRACR|nr:hypothetical protein F2Q69_00015049 [Brassica cretica]
MDQDDATFGAPGGEPTPTPKAAPPIAADFMSSIMARLARQDEVQKTTNDQLAALVAALTAPDGQTNRPQQIRRRVFNTNPTATGGDHISDDSEPNETLLADHPPAGSDLATIRELTELKLSFQQMSEKIHQVTSTAPQIESILVATSHTPFTSALTKNIRSSGDNDTSSGDDDSRSGDDDSSSGDDDSSSAVVGRLISRHPAGRPAKAYMFCGTGLGRHSEDCSPHGTSPL